MKRAISLALLVLLLCPCIQSASAQDYAYGAWLPYWDLDSSLPEAESLGADLDVAIAFACLFDNKDRPFMLEEARSALDSLQRMFDGTETTVFLSIVNDIEVSRGKYENKSADLLRRLFQDETAMSSHLEALAALIDDYAPDGLELDYENIKKDTTLWAAYAAFIEKAWAMCERDGVRLRVVLPWDAPRYVHLPEGPEYTVMCYNLYGYHSGPGPKADLNFLRTTCELYQGFCGKVSMAFATGGFTWRGSEIKSVTQEEAEKLLLDAGVTPIRDDPSGALTATFESNGEPCEIWYADGATLAAWRDACADYGYTAFDLFRLGGNSLEDWNAAFFGTQP